MVERSLSPICTDGLATLRGARHGGWRTAQDHVRALTGGRCRFYAEPRDEAALYSAANVRLESIGLQYFLYDWPGECRTRTERAAQQDVVLYIPLRGSFTASQHSKSVEVRAGEMLLAGTSGEIRRTWRGALEIINLVVPIELLNRLLVTEYGHDAEDAIEFEPLALIATDHVPTLVKFIEAIVRDAALAAPIFADPIAAKPVQNALLHILLHALPHSHSDRVRGDRSSIAPYYVRRAESHIIRHLAGDITIEELAQIAGVSPRTIYYGFKRYRLMTPMKFLKRIRLKKAHGDLVDAEQGARTVSDVAGRYGYANASQFSRDYKSLFGESPQATLRRTGSC